MAVFPALYPNPEYTPHSMELRTGVTRMGMQAGNFKQRRLWSKLPVQWSLIWSAKTAEMQSMIRWLNKNGYVWFDIYVVSPLTPGSTAPLRLMTVRLISSLSVNSSGYDRWEISAIAEGEPSQTLAVG